jgi:hypothetical protein
MFGILVNWHLVDILFGLFIKKHLADQHFPYIFDIVRTMPIDQKALVGHVVWHFGLFMTYLIPCHLSGIILAF